jgi:possible transglycosylase
MGTSAEQGILMDVVVGIAGGLIGGFLLKVVTTIASVRIVGSGGLIFSFLTSLLGAVVLLAVLRFFRGRR